MIDMTKIIIVTPWFGEFAGGAEVLAKSLAVEFNHRGIETLIFTTCCKSPYADWWHNDYEEGEYDVYGLKTFRFSVNTTKILYEDALGHFIHHKEQMTEERYQNFFIAGINSDTLVQNLGPYINDGYEVIAMPYYQGLTHSVVNAYPEKVSITPCFHDEEPFYWKPIETMLENAKHIFYNTQEEKALTIKNYGKIIGKKLIEATVTGVGVEVSNPSYREKSHLNIPSNYFIYMGRKEEGKNVPLLIKWFSSYIKENKIGAKLVFIGGGDSSIIPSNKHFIDYAYVSETNKQYLLKNAKGLINLSKNESFSIVLMEAWLSKIPVIVHGNCEVTKGHAIKANGGLFPENEEEFIGCLEYLLLHRDESNEMGTNGYGYVEEHYSHDTVLEKYLKVLEEK
jgi:glycosyltransferase involved in cell wall biosynthesis